MTRLFVIRLLGILAFVSLAARPAPAQQPEAVGPGLSIQDGVQNKTVLRLADLEQLALQRNPTLTQAAAAIEVSQGRALQAGLPANPVIGYVGEQMGVHGTAGERQGLFVQQEIVTGGKLGLSRAKYRQETNAAGSQAVAQQHRVLNDVRIAFFEVLAAQQRIAIDRDLVEIADAGVKTTGEMLNVGQANQPDLLQAQVDAHRARVAISASEKEYQRSWRHLTALVGAPELRPAELSGQLEAEGEPLQYEAVLGALLEQSPEIAFVRTEVQRDQLTLQREMAEPTPNVQLQAATGYNFETRNTTADLSVGLNIPLFNKNQGTIRQAEAELQRARAEVCRVELMLRDRLAAEFTRYQTALDSVDDYRRNSLPKAKEASDLYNEYFQKGRAAWPQVLVARRTYAQLREEYVRELLETRRSEIALRGFLLTGGLVQPPGPTPEGHLDSTPQPR